MRGYDAGRWLLLATLWSLQFLFMRLAVPVLGSPLVAEARAFFAAAFLVPWAILAAQRIAPLARWRDHLVIALANNVLPFLAFAWAANGLPAGYLAIINGTVPLWTGLFAAALIGERLGARRLAGFALGIAGVALIVNLGPVSLEAATILAALAALAGAALWGWAGVLIRQRMAKLAPIGIAAGSISFAAILMSPAWVLGPPPQAWTPEAAAAVIALGLLCSGVAYLPFFTLLRDIGPSRTLSVTFLIPVLGVLWGWLFLDEAVTVSVLVGAALVLGALGLVLRR
ncbi:MAG TPA: DMT family transporter [Burkholderiales bacterium]|nr:DMT family transporter [Burkholderiales bacterium]